MRPAALIVLIVSGCTIADEPYPLRWDPLPTAPSADCSHFRGVYADRGESVNVAKPPSLTRELFGEDSPWPKAVSIALDPGDGGLDVRVVGSTAEPYSRRLTAKTGEYACDKGKMVIKSRRWVYSDLMSGRETVKIEMHSAEQHLVVHVDETTSGVMFMVVPLSGESARWFRFRRLQP